MVRQGQQLKVLSSGGDDFDTAFAKWVASGIWQALSIDVTKDAILSDKIQRQCELVKRALSSKAEVRYLIADALGSAGRQRSIDVMVKREQLSVPWGELVDRSIEATRTAFLASNLEMEQIGGVLLIGGTTAIPQVRAAVAQHFPRPLAVENEPQTAVARGAALLAAQPGLLGAIS